MQNGEATMEAIVTSPLESDQIFQQHGVSKTHPSDERSMYKHHQKSPKIVEPHTPVPSTICALREPWIFRNSFIVTICLPGILHGNTPLRKELLDQVERVGRQKSEDGKMWGARIVYHKPHKVDKYISVGGGRLAHTSLPQIRIHGMPFLFPLGVPSRSKLSSLLRSSDMEIKTMNSLASNKTASIGLQTNTQDSDDFSLDDLCMDDWTSSSVPTESMETKQVEKLHPNRPHQALEYPPLYFLLKRFPQFMESTKTWYMYRWKASYPLQKKLPCSRVLRKIGVHLTWGEAILLLPFWAALASAIIYSVVFPSVVHSGYVARAGLIGCFVFAQRNSLLTALVGMPIDRTLYYHKLSGRLALVATIGHAWSFYIDPRFQVTNATIRAKLASSLEGCVNTAGTMMATMLFIISISSLPLVRRRLFELFYYMHILCAGGLALGAFFHTGLLVVPSLVACTWGVDLFFRSIVMARHRYPTKATIRTLSATVIELSFPKIDGFDYNPGQYIYLCLPGISYLEWHPFSISSAPKMKNVTLHIRRSGNWTSSLYELAKQGKEVDILIEGPYGNLGVDLFGDRYKMVILVSGGIGITPMQSICDQLLFEEARKQRKMKKIKFVWTDRDPVMMMEAPVVRRMSSVDFEASSNSELESADAESDASIYERNSPIIFSQLVSLLPPGTATDDGLDNFYDCLSELMDQDAEFLGNSNSTFQDSGDDLDAMADDTSVADNNAPWDRDPECNKSVGEILEMQLFHTGAQSEFHIPYARRGRPDIKKIFLEMKKEAKEKREDRVAVCVCAPQKLSALCRKACIVYSDKDVCFDFHAESMEA